MDCSDLNRFLNNEMTDEEQKIFKEHTKQCKVCKIQTEFYNSLEINNIPHFRKILKFQLWPKYTTSQSSMVL